jgi:hypothetical protein
MVLLLLCHLIINAIDHISNSKSVSKQNLDNGDGNVYYCVLYAVYPETEHFFELHRWIHPSLTSAVQFFRRQDLEYDCVEGADVVKIIEGPSGLMDAEATPISCILCDVFYT